MHRQALLAVIDRRARRLCEKSLARGRKLYEPKPKRFVREIERGWRKRARAPQPKPRRPADLRTRPYSTLAASAASALSTSTASTARS